MIERRTCEVALGRVQTALFAPYQMFQRLSYERRREALDETACKFVSSRGIARSCRALIDPRSRSASRIDAKRLGELEANEPVYMFTGCIPDFVDHHLHRFEHPFTLVTGADDYSVSRASLGAEVDILLSHPLLTHWFAQNAEIAHTKLSLIPIGMDYHTLTGNHDRPWRRFQAPVHQESELIEARSAAPRVADRSCAAYSNWHFFLHRGDRQDCFDKVDHSCVFFEPEMVPRRQSWTTNSQYLFTISPLVNGLVCHRTWEALLLGTIPIVHTSALDRLYEGLPVCIVNDWSEVTAKYLRDQRETMLPREFDYDKVSLEYWTSLIRGRFGLGTRQSIQDFATELQ